MESSQPINEIHRNPLAANLSHHWIAPLAFLPFGAMLAIHKMFGMHDELIGGFVGLYNLAMALSFYAGVAAYSIQAFLMFLGSRESASHWVWAIAKLVVLVFGWVAMLFMVGGL